MYFVTHLVAVLMYHFYWLNMIACVLLLESAVYHGACYYMDYFAKKYEK